MEKSINNLEDMNYRVFLRDDGTLFIYYNDGMSLYEKYENIKNGSFFVKDLESINIEKLDLPNIHEINVNFDGVDYENFDKSAVIDSVIAFYNVMQTKTQEDICIAISSNNDIKKHSIGEEVMKKYEMFDNPEDVYIIPSYVNNSPYFLPISYIKEIDEEIKIGISDIKNSELSPLEKVMACYFVVEKLFNNIACSNKVVPSHYIDDVYNGFDVGYMNSLGYANLFKFMLGQIDVECDFIVDENNNHMFNSVTIKDGKYNVDGTYVFDTAKDADYYYEVISNNSYNPEFSAISYFGTDGDEGSISEDNLLKCLYNVNCFIYNDNVNVDNLANTFALNMVNRNNLMTSKDMKDYFYSYANERLSSIKDNDLDSLFQTQKGDRETSKKESHI